MPLLDILRRFLSVGAAEAEAEYRPAARAPAGGTAAFPVLVAAVENDDGATAQAVAEALTQAGGFAVQVTQTGIGAVDDSETIPGSLAAAVRRARTMAEVHDVKAVVAGQRLDDEPLVRLRFIPAAVDGNPAGGIWSIGDAIDVPLPFPDGAGPLIAACAAACLHLGTDEERRRRLELLHRTIQAGERLIQGEGAALTGRARTVGAIAYAAMLVEMGIRTRQRPLLERAQDVLEAAVRKNKSLPAVLLAAARLHLADIAADLGGRDKDAERLEAAAKQYEAAADVFAAELFRDDNAAIWAQYGRAMHRLSGITGKTDHMKAAVQGYRKAAAVWTRAVHEERWAELQHGMGAVLGQFGEFTGAVPALERAVKVFEGVAEVWTRETNPRRWAALQNNMGACRFAQGKRTGELPPLRDAAECFSLALEVYQSLGMTQNIHVTQKNLARVERLIQVQESKGG